MTARQVVIGRRVRLEDPVWFAHRMRAADGTNRIVGAGGVTLPREVLDQPGVIAAHAAARTRVLIHWPEFGDLGAWCYVEMLKPVRPSRSAPASCADCGEAHATGGEALGCEHRLGRHTQPRRGCAACGTP